jgi:hypothetical protein
MGFHADQEAMRVLVTTRASSKIGLEIGQISP